MINYRKTRWMMIALGVIGWGWNAVGWSDQTPSASPPGAHQSSQAAERRPLHVWHGPLSLFFVEMDELKLSPTQQELWEKAQQQTSEAFDRAQIISRNMRDQLRVELDQPGADLKQIIQREEEIRPQIAAAFKPARDAWFAAYDSLDTGQKERLREAVREGMDFPPVFPAPPSPPGVQPH